MPQFGWESEALPSGRHIAATFAVAAAIFAVGFASSYGSDGVSNQPPTLDDIPSQTVDELSELTFTVSASDPDLPADVLHFSLSGEPPSGASIDPSSGIFFWTPAENQNGTHILNVTVSDGAGGADHQAVQVTVNEVNSPPTLSTPSVALAFELAEMTPFTANATDPDYPPDVLTFSLVDPPEGASIDPVTGTVRWTPTERQDGVAEIRVVVSDGRGGSDSGSTYVIVVETNEPPVISPVPEPAGSALSSFNFYVRATDADTPANTLTYDLVDPPAGASIDSLTGLFSWAPDGGEEGPILV